MRQGEPPGLSKETLVEREKRGQLEPSSGLCVYTQDHATTHALTERQIHTHALIIKESQQRKQAGKTNVYTDPLRVPKSERENAKNPTVHRSEQQ